MNINPLIEQIFQKFIVDGENIPISYMHYDGNSKKYLTYYTWSETPQEFYNDAHNAEVCYGTIDVWSLGNFKNIAEKVKKTLIDNGFVWTDNGAETYETDTEYFHVAMNFYYSAQTSLAQLQTENQN
jgi:hypothetical protein